MAERRGVLMEVSMEGEGRGGGLFGIVHGGAMSRQVSPL